ALAARAHEQRGVLDQRHRHLLVAGGTEDLLRARDHGAADRHPLRQPVLGAGRRLEAATHAATRARTPSRNGLLASSWSSVVGPEWPDRTGASRGQLSYSRTIESSSVANEPPGRSVR